MRKLEKKQFLKNVGSSWFSLGVNVLVGVFLSPFIMHRLGDTAFGIWVSDLFHHGYFGIFDLGISTSVIRYVSKYTATGETDKLARYVIPVWPATAQSAYSAWLPLSCSASTLIGSSKFRRECTGRPELLLLLVGGSVSLGFPLGISIGILGRSPALLPQQLDHRRDVAHTCRVDRVLSPPGYGLITIALITCCPP